MAPQVGPHRRPWFLRGRRTRCLRGHEERYRQQDAADPIEQHGSRPDFQALIYPGSSGTFTVEPGMPPAFLAAGYGDRPDIAEGLAAVYLKYKAAKVPAELHIFANAGHGCGYRHDAKPSAAARWPNLVAGIVQATLDRADGRPDIPADLILRQPVDIVVDERVAIEGLERPIPSHRC